MRPDGDGLGILFSGDPNQGVCDSGVVGDGEAGGGHSRLPSQGRSPLGYTSCRVVQLLIRIEGRLDVRRDWRSFERWCGRRLEGQARLPYNNHEGRSWREQGRGFAQGPL
jgi:hypothetical protein